MARVIHIRNWQRGNPDHVYIGRSGRGRPGPFGNPIVIGKACPSCRAVHGDAGSTLPCYEAYLLDRLVKEPAFQAQVADLFLKTLVCFCKPGPCHGDILARYSAELASSRAMMALEAAAVGVA